MSLDVRSSSVGPAQRLASPLGRVCSSTRRCLRARRTRRLTVLAGKASGQVFVAGADGVMGSRIAKELAESGFSVAAGITDSDQVEPVSRFLTRFALAPGGRLKVVDMDDEALNSAFGRGARVVCVDGDVAWRKKLGAQHVSRVLEAAQEKKASDFVLVSCGGGGGGLFGGGAGGARMENLVAESGLDYAIIRGSASDRLGGSSNGIVVGPPGKIKGLNPSRSQVADVVAAVLMESCSGVVLDVKVDSAGSSPPLAEQLAAAVKG